MSTPFNAAAAAYSNASRLISGAATQAPKPVNDGAQGADFASLLSQSMGSVVEAGRTSDQMALDMVNGKANVVDVVTAISETELAIESMVTVRDRVISAYEEIMRMPI
ncbi:flagellar hook-basal body complex protein FliE [Arsenicitalea aurantiaca]|uniref:Flagellar hook-basal body complex protein FliE n=1 Tax=Arsenicitalea aurantiaca TaxID=1783274 RepID=A0A433XGA7_9HYPH|nr:flagellar hook-basal body complex protein FliE [Arsenicitalea aurantiaca]RUT33115.1 flagellar hook-basal body complex protein FliE [Arsenicitalea aurantiaca]